MHDRSAGSHQRNARLGQAPHPRVFAQRRQQSAFLALLLQPERDHSVRAVERAVEIGLVCRASRGLSAPPRARHERRRTGQCDRRAQRDERVDVRSRDAAVHDVADDHDALLREVAKRGTQRVGVEEALGRMRVPAVAGVDHRGVGALGDEVRGTRRAMPHHDDISAQRLERANGVVQRLTLLDRRAAGRNVHHVRRQRAGGELERHARAGRRFGEEQHDRPPAERRRSSDRPRKDFDHRSGGVQHGLDLLGRPVVRVEVVPPCPPHALTRSRAISSTSSRPSTSVRCTRTSSEGLVGTFLPTKSARIGSSRWPRSTSTARRMARGRP